MKKTLFTNNNCPSCMRVKELIFKLNIQDQYNIIDDYSIEENKNLAIKYSVRAVPVLLIEDDMSSKILLGVIDITNYIMNKLKDEPRG